MAAADQVDVDVDSFGSEVCELVGDISQGVIENTVETELLDGPLALLGSPSGSNHLACSEKSRELPSHATDGSCGRRDEHAVALSNRRGLRECDVGGEAG